MPSYTLEGLDDLEMSAETATPEDQKVALAFVVGILEDIPIGYGVMGGMNFHLRGSGRTTTDIDVAIDNSPRMRDLLRVFDSEKYRERSVLSAY